MVTNASSFGRSGTHGYIMLRSTAIIIALYTFYFVGFVAFSDLSYRVWSDFFASTGTKVFTLLALIALIIHAWIGVWQVLSDYVKSTGLRGFLQFILTTLTLVYALVGFVVLWGV